MFKTSFAKSLLLAVFMYAGTAFADADLRADFDGESISSAEAVEKLHRLGHYGVLSNQVEVVSGSNVLWSPTPTTISHGISIDDLGNITLYKHGLYLIEYTVRVTKSPFDGTASVVVQLQQTSSGVPTNVAQSSVNSNTSIDGISDAVPQSQFQITGYALIRVNNNRNNKINLAFSATPDGNLTVPATSGSDANAQMVILQIR